jgi:putative transposase
MNAHHPLRLVVRFFDKHKKAYRLWRQEGLNVRGPRRGRRVGPSTHAPVLIAHAPNVMWRSNFQYDSTTDGRLIKFLSACPHLTPTC